MGANDPAKGRKQYCVFARFMRAIHADELAHGIGEFAPIIRVFQRLIRREMHCHVS